MKKILLLALGTMLPLISFCQITFEKGYFLTEAGQTSTALIKLNEIADNPVRIQYKLSPNGSVKTANISTIKEFAIGDFHKFIRETVEIDRSEDDFANISPTRNPVFNEETLFLRSLVEGEYSLLFYRDGNLQRFFVRKPDGEIEQLIYKKYSTGNNIVRKNNRYRQQLLNLFACEEISQKHLKNLGYTRSELIDLFQKYHECKNQNYRVLHLEKEGNLNIMIKAGLNFTNFGMEQDVYNIVENFQYDIDPRIGVELEYIPPMMNRKVALYMEPSFSLYNSKKEIIIATETPTPSNPGGPGGYRAEVEMNYQTLDLPLGLRYYFFLGEANNTKMFFNSGASINLIFNSSTILNRGTDENSKFDFNQSWQPTFFGGLGIRYKEKFSLEARYFPVRPLTDNGGYKLHQNHSFAVVAGYTVF